MLHTLLSLLFLTVAGAPPTEPAFRAGVAKAVITPEKPMWMSGYASRTKPAEGKHTDLYAKALLLEDARKHRLLLVTLDLVGIGADVSDLLFDELNKAKLRFGRSEVIINCSHTHSGPVVGHNLLAMYQLDQQNQQLVKDYVPFLKRRVLEAVQAAHDNLAPARLTWAVGHCSLAVNRRTNKEADVPKLRAAGQLQGPVDHDVPVLAVWPKTEGGPLAIVFGYACHATVLSGYDWSGDYPGCAQRELEKAYPGSVALFWAGCGGDQNPLPRRKVELAEKYGAELADSVQAVLRGAMKPLAGTFRVADKTVPLQLSSIPNREQLAEQTRSDNKYIVARAKMLLEKLDKEGRIRAAYDYSVWAWQLGDGPTVVALGGEVVVDYALRLKKELGPAPTWVMGYSNDVMAYIPSARVLREGGYEGATSMIYYGLPSPWDQGIEDRIVATVLEIAQRVRRNANR